MDCPEAHVAGRSGPDVAEQPAPAILVPHLQPEAAAVAEAARFGEAADLESGESIEGV